MVDLTSHQALPMLAIHPSQRRRYPSKFCHHLRTRKRNGELHRFCEEHRKRANENQERWSASRQRRVDEEVAMWPQMQEPSCQSLDKEDPIWSCLLEFPLTVMEPELLGFTQLLSSDLARLTPVPPPSAPLSDVDFQIL